MTALEIICYLIGLAAELSGAALLIGQARRVLAPQPIQRTTYADLLHISEEVDTVRRSQVPTRLGIGLLLAGIVFGYAGNFLSLA